MSISRYAMMTCNNLGCAVNTFEYFTDGICPGCWTNGEVVDYADLHSV